MALDSSGNIYMTGSFSGTADFDPGPGTFYLTSAGAGDIFVIKTDAQGHFIWARAMGGDTDDIGLSIALDGEGNIYTIGNFTGLADLDPGPGVFGLSSNGLRDFFILKLDTSGSFLWAVGIGGTDDDRGTSIALQGTGEVYATGAFRATVDFDPGPAVFNLTSSGYCDIYVLKLDPQGSLVWAKRAGAGTSDRGYAIGLDAAGNSYITGYFQQTVDFDPGPGVYNLTSAGNSDIFIWCLSSPGDLVWAKAMGGASTDNGNAIALDAAGNIYTTGSFCLTADFDPGTGVYSLTSSGSMDVFVSKLDASGNFIWAKAMGGSLADAGRGLSVNTAQQVYTTGAFYDVADFNPGLGTCYLTSAGMSDIFVSKLDVLGDFVWAKAMGGDGAKGDEGKSLVLDDKDRVYTVGFFCDTADFDPGKGTYHLTGAGDMDIYVNKTSTDLDVKVLLEGPFEGSSMHTGLNSLGFLPLSQPYGIPPWNYPGSESVGVIPNSDVVDWVLVELRDTLGVSQAFSSTRIARRAGFLLRDGTIRAPDGLSPLTFDETVNYNLFSLIWHRNHLAVISAFPLTGNGGMCTYDYTTGADQAFGGSNAHKELGTGIWGMCGGDANKDGQVNHADKIDVWLPQAGSSGYKAGDLDLDGQVSNADKVDVWSPNSGASSQVPD
jgi:hypothetical protein